MTNITGIATRSDRRIRRWHSWNVRKHCVMHELVVGLLYSWRHIVAAVYSHSYRLTPAAYISPNKSVSLFPSWQVST